MRHSGMVKWISGCVFALTLVALALVSPAASVASSAALNRNSAPPYLPKACSFVPRLAAVSPSPFFSNGPSIFDEVPAALATQFPSVFGGVIAAPSAAGESPVKVNSHFIVLERVHDPALEAEARTAYKAPLTVAFALTPRTAQCLADVSASVKKQSKAIASAGINLVGYGTAAKRIDVDVTECKGKDARSAIQWFSSHWGSAIAVNTCWKIPTAEPLAIPAAGQTLPTKVISVTATLEPYNPQLTTQGIPAEEVTFTVGPVSGNFSCQVDVLRSGQTVGSKEVSIGGPGGNLSSEMESVSVEQIKGGTFVGTTSNARVACHNDAHVP
jgi:hypothetical protein